MYLDIHTHLNAAAFDSDYREAAERAHTAQVQFVNVGTMFRSSERAVMLARELGAYASVGLHPIYTAPSHHDSSELGADTSVSHEGEVFSYEAYRALAEAPEVVAIGECGLDFFRVTDDEAIARQREVFLQHIELANVLKKPLMLHLRSGSGRNAYREAYDLLKTHAKVQGNSHFFAGSLEDAQHFWDMGYSTSFTGVLTFTNDYNELVRHAPRELIHAETDAPLVAPKPYRGQRNEPAYVVEVAKCMAALRGEGTDAWAAQLSKNAARMFGIRNRADTMADPVQRQTVR